MENGVGPHFLHTIHAEMGSDPILISRK